MKKVLKTIFLLILIIVIVAIATIAIFFKSKLNKINYENIGRADIEINEGVEEDLSNYTNIALLGLDAKDNTFANSRSDCIMIISINDNTKDVNIVSVYRDTYLQIDGHGLDKVTHAYAYGRAPLAISTINKNLDLDIVEYVTINFDSVIKIVDAIGGVDIEVTDQEATQIPGIYSAGTYTLNGTQALAYGRIRKIDSDYARTERMRNVVIKVFDKIKGMSYTKLNNLIDELLPEVSTNITQNKIISYTSKISQYKVKNSFGWPYDVQGYSTTIWYAAPVTLESNVKKLHLDLFGTSNYQVSNTVKDINDSIISKTGYNN